MSSKFTECTLGQMYRKVDHDGQVLGGPMRYLNAGLSDVGQETGLGGILRPLGLVLAVIFALWLVRLGTPRASEPAVVRETIIPG